MNADKISTIVGAVAAAATAAGPVINVAGTGSLHQSDYFGLVTAVMMAVWGFFTNKGAPNAK